VKDRFQFGQQLNRLIGRVEAWSYGDSDAGAGLPVELAQELKALASIAPTLMLRQGVRRAQDALDDGLSAEAVAAALYAVRAELIAGGSQLSAPPSPPGRRSPNRGRSPKRGRSP
jgi:hypothetical protein